MSFATNTLFIASRHLVNVGHKKPTLFLKSKTVTLFVKVFAEELILSSRICLCSIMKTLLRCLFYNLGQNGVETQKIKHGMKSTGYHEVLE